MNRRLPPDAFEFYFALGLKRSYAAVAEKYGVAKKTVVARAMKEAWQQRILDREKQAQDHADKKAVESIEAMRERHLKVYQAMQRKAVEAMRNIPITNATQLVRTIEVALDGERLVRGEPTERIDIATVIREQYQALALRPGQQEDWSDLERPAG